MTDARTIPMAEWGKDHWSALSYIETCAVDRHGFIDGRRMRSDGTRYPTRLKRVDPDQERLEPGHSDFDCVRDLMAAGLVVAGPDTTAGGRIPFHEIEARARKYKTASARNETNRYALTPKGIKLAAALRKHKAEGGNFAGFRWPVVKT